MGDRREPNVVLQEERLLPSPPSTSSNPHLSLIGPERWARAEKATQNIIGKVQPTVVSEERRREVIDYVQRLIRGCLGCEVFPYGSVPLKTYLPDGDIDLTAFGGVSFEDALANDIVSVLEGEDQNREAEFVVKDVQLIRAEVKLVKCIVQNIVVDISFNQIGGLCTLCFLEQVDGRIGKDHLFKRSIILIKAWCYYESRILGAHHGLISTYALETLVLYIFHLFHSTLNGPLAVLYKFLDYFSKFDWYNYCISLTGPVRISSLPEIVAETPESDGSNLLISDDFLRYCVDMFSVPSKSVDINSRTFPQKHLNIVDPLKENNNLGRSVSKGNFYRIRSAFTYGARKLRQILLQPEESIGDELCNFFSNTLKRHGSGQRPDVQDPVPTLCHNGLSPAISFSETYSCQIEKGFSELHSPNGIGMNGDCKFCPEDSLLNVKSPAVEVKLSRTESEQQRASVELLGPTMLLEVETPVREGTPLGNHCSGDAKDLANSRIQRLKISDDTSRSSHQSDKESHSHLGVPYHAPHLYFSNTVNGKMRSRNLDQMQFEKHCSSEDKVFSGSMQESTAGAILAGHNQENSQLVCSDEVPSLRKLKDLPSIKNSVSSEESHQLICDGTSASTSGSPESLNFLSDLSGDYDSHFNCLQFGRWCYEYAASSPTLPMSPSPLSQFQGKKWDAIQHASHFKRNGFHVIPSSVIHTNGVIPNPAYYHMSPLVIPGAAFGLEEMPKPRGTGTYFPRTNRPPHGYRPSTVKGRSQGTVRSPRSNGWAVSFMEANAHERNSRELSQSQFPFNQGNRSGSLDVHQSIPPGKKMPNNANGFLPYEVVEFGSVGHVSLEALPSVENIRQTRAATSPTQISSPSHLTLAMRRSKPAMAIDRDSVAMQSTYHLKDDDDFPPLSV